MQFNFKSTKPAARAASRLPRFLADIFPLPPEFHLKDGTAFVLGHDDWATLSKSCIPDASLSLRDEDCTPDELTKRRAFQAARLEEFCGRYGLTVDGAKVVADWRPSAARPQEKTESFVNAEQMRADGRPQRCIILLMELEFSGRVPAPAEVDYLIESFRSCKGETLELVETFAAPLAIRLVNMKEGETPQQGFRILEALVANGCEYSLVSLAKALRNGWGGDEDHHRARSLVTSVLNKVDHNELDFLEPASYVELFSLAAYLWMHAPGGLRDRAKAFELYLHAANMGHGPSALIVSSFLMPLPAGHEVDEFAGVVEPDMRLAEAYYLQAERCGYNPATKQFDLVELA